MHRDVDLSSLQLFPAQRQGTLAVVTIALALAYVLLAYFGTTASMVAIWLRSETFAHGIVVIPIFLYLAWRERAALGRIVPEPSRLALVGIAAAAAIAWLGERVNAVSVPQLAMIAMVPLAVWALLGARAVRVLAFPLAFLFFAVPFGEFMVPRLIDWTADFTVWAIQLSGVPIYREGNMFTIPSGRWSVVEACSGLRYLIASAMVGVLFAYLSYRSARRRALFIAASIIVPLVANWLRAYGIVMLGHLSGNRLAVGVDHLIYGWIFFGVVMLLLFMVGSRWREDLPDEPAREAAIAAPGVERWTPRMWQAAAALAVIVGAGGWLDAAARSEGRPGDLQLARLAAVDGWTPATEFSRWHPDLAGANGTLRQTFVRDGVPVGIDVSIYRDQTRQAKALSSLNQLVQPSNQTWLQTYSGHAELDGAGGAFAARSAVVAGSAERLAVRQWFWVDGQVTASPVVVTFHQVLAILRGRSDAVAWVVLYTPLDRGEDAAARALAAFARAAGGPLDTTLRAAADAR
jgi:exosortase A